MSVPSLLVVAAIAAGPVSAQQPPKMKPPKSRFELAAPLPSIPPVVIDTFYSGSGIANELAKAHGLQGRMMWVDGTANLDKVSTEASVKELVGKIKDSGFNVIVFDVKPISGQTLYPSKLAPKIKEWRGKTLPESFDPLLHMVRECKAADINLLISLNAFSEGHAMFKVGPGYDKLDWQTVLYEYKPLVRLANGSTFPLSGKANALALPNSLAIYNDAAKMPRLQEGQFAITIEPTGSIVDGFEGVGAGEPPTIPRRGWAIVGVGAAADFLRANAIPGTVVRIDTEAEFVPISERPDQQFPLMVNPNHPEVRAYELAILNEIATNYEIGGILYDDRLRYAGINADFSETSRKAFEGWIGKELNWPDDVFKFTLNASLQRGIAPGPYYDAWMAWRANSIKSFTLEARKTLLAARPDASFGIYAGSWYGEYPALGTNWASPDFEAGFWFLTPEYSQTGLASQLDLLVTGAYYPTATINQALRNATSIGGTVEAAGGLTVQAARDQTWSYTGIMLSQFKGNPQGLKDALQAACASSQGVMVFDVSHDDTMWPVFNQAFSAPRRAPHLAPEVLREVRARRANYDKLGHRGRPTIIAAGSAGTGQ